MDEFTILLGALILEFSKGDPRGKVLAVGVDHDHAHLGVVFQLPESVIEFPGEGNVEGIHLLRAIEGNEADQVLLVYQHVGISHGIAPLRLMIKEANGGTLFFMPGRPLYQAIVSIIMAVTEQSPSHLQGR